VWVNSFPFDEVLQLPTNAPLLKNAVRLPKLLARRELVVARVGSVLGSIVRFGPFRTALPFWRSHYTGRPLGTVCGLFTKAIVSVSSRQVQKTWIIIVIVIDAGLPEPSYLTCNQSANERVLGLRAREIIASKIAKVRDDKHIPQTCAMQSVWR
jgi:hypothetical protein